MVAVVVVVVEVEVEVAVLVIINKHKSETTSINSHQFGTGPEEKTNGTGGGGQSKTDPNRESAAARVSSSRPRLISAVLLKDKCGGEKRGWVGGLGKEKCKKERRKRERTTLFCSQIVAAAVERK